MQAALSEPDYPEEEIVGSRNHSYLQTTLTVELFHLERFAVYSELSLDIAGKEYKPDLALYPPEVEPEDFQDDIVRMTDMPLCAIEILSPRQFLESLTDKLKVYFPAGIQSCWLVIPNLRLVSVYSDIKTARTFTSGEVIDDQLNIRLPLARIFRQQHPASGGTPS